MTDLVKRHLARNQLSEQRHLLLKTIFETKNSLSQTECPAGRRSQQIEYSQKVVLMVAVYNSLKAQTFNETLS